MGGKYLYHNSAKKTPFKGVYTPLHVHISVMHPPLYIGT